MPPKKQAAATSSNAKSSVSGSANSSASGAIRKSTPACSPVGDSSAEQQVDDASLTSTPSDTRPPLAASTMSAAPMTRSEESSVASAFGGPILPPLSAPRPNYAPYGAPFVSSAPFSSSAPFVPNAPFSSSAQFVPNAPFASNAWNGYYPQASAISSTGLPVAGVIDPRAYFGLPLLQPSHARIPDTTLSSASAPPGVPSLQPVHALPVQTQAQNMASGSADRVPEFKAPPGFRLPAVNLKKITTWLKNCETLFRRHHIHEDEERLTLANLQISEADSALAYLVDTFPTWVKLRKYLEGTFGMSEEDRRDAVAKAPNRGNMPMGQYLAVLSEAAQARDPRDQAIRDRMLKEIPRELKWLVETMDADNADLAEFIDKKLSSGKSNEQHEAATSVKLTSSTCAVVDAASNNNNDSMQMRRDIDSLRAEMSDLCAAVRYAGFSSSRSGNYAPSHAGSGPGQATSAPGGARSRSQQKRDVRKGLFLDQSGKNLCWFHFKHREKAYRCGHQDCQWPKNAQGGR